MTDIRTAPYAALLLRLCLAGLFAAHLYQKFAIRGLSAWWSALQKAGYPDWVLYYTVSAEFVGAVLLLLGIYTRYVSLYALPLMIAATHFWAVRKGFYFTDAGWEFPLAWSIMLIVQALLGDGAYAVRVPTLPWDRGTQRSTVEA